MKYVDEGVYVCIDDLHGMTFDMSKMQDLVNKFTFKCNHDQYVYF